MTSVLALVRSGRLPLPGDPRFAAADWEAAASANAEDPQLITSALWFDRQLKAAWEDVDALKLGRVDRARLLEELCGRCNYVFAHSEAALDAAMRAADPGSLPMGSVAHLLFRTTTGDVGNADALRTGATDTLGRALRYLSTIPPRRGKPFGVAERAAEGFAAFSKIYVLEFYLQKVVWQGWCVTREGDAWSLNAPDPDHFGVSTIAVDWRREQEHGEWTLVASKAWQEGRGWPETTATDTGRRGAARFVATVHMPGEASIPLENVLRWHIEGSDLTAVQDRPLPAFPNEPVSLADFIDTVLLWGSAARSILDGLSQLSATGRTRAFAPPVTAQELVALRQRSGWSRDKAEAVLEFLTFSGGAFDGVWSKPLVRLPSGELIPVFSALIGPNLYRSAEIWLAEAGGDLIQQSRGATFEDSVRRDLRDALRTHKLEHIVVADPWSVKIAGGRRDIDLAIRIDQTVFVGEQKLKRFPAGPREAARWADELAKGTEQARLRCDFLTKHPQSAAQHTRFAGAAADLAFVPFVCASGPFGTGISIDGTPVIDAAGLQEFFDPGFFGTWGELLPGSTMKATMAVPLRVPGDDLATAFKAYLQDPVRIRAIERAMRPFPRTVGFKANDDKPIFCREMMVDHRRFTDGPALYRDVLQQWNEARVAAGLPSLEPTERSTVFGAHV